MVTTSDFYKGFEANCAKVKTTMPEFCNTRYVTLENPVTEKVNKMVVKNPKDLVFIDTKTGKASLNTCAAAGYCA